MRKSLLKRITPEDKAAYMARKLHINELCSRYGVTKTHARRTLKRGRLPRQTPEGDKSEFISARKTYRLKIAEQYPAKSVVELARIANCSESTFYRVLREHLKNVKANL